MDFHILKLKSGVLLLFSIFFLLRLIKREEYCNIRLVSQSVKDVSIKDGNIEHSIHSALSDQFDTNTN